MAHVSGPKGAVRVSIKARRQVKKRKRKARGDLFKGSGRIHRDVAADL